MEKRYKSAIPIYIGGTIWILYGIIFPVYKLIHLIIAFILLFLAYYLSKKFFPDRIVKLEEVLKYTGEKDLDEALAQGNFQLEEIRKIRDQIKDQDLLSDVNKISETSLKIFKHITDNPKKLIHVRRFISYYLPTTTKLLKEYLEAESHQQKSENLLRIKEDVTKAMKEISKAFDTYLDQLYEDKAMDIDSEIQVFDSLMRAENLKK